MFAGQYPQWRGTILKTISYLGSLLKTANLLQTFNEILFKYCVTVHLFPERIGTLYFQKIILIECVEHRSVNRSPAIFNFKSLVNQISLGLIGWSYTLSIQSNFQPTLRSTNVLPENSNPIFTNNIRKEQYELVEREKIKHHHLIENFPEEILQTSTKQFV